MLLPLVIALLAGSVTSFDYCTLSAQNTLCKYKPTSYGTACMKIVPMSVTAADKSLIVDLHNKMRRQVAKAMEKGGNPGPQPAAANMRAMSWDDELALMAQTHAQQCVFTHDVDRNIARFKVGQNLAIQFSTVEMKKSNWTSMIQSWYDEVKTMSASYVASFPSKPTGVIGHYTQMVWAKTFKIGCGIVSYYDTKFQPKYPYKLFYVCNYGEAGNYLSTPVYKTGTAASACPAPTVPKDGLCA
ncbi:venom allergen 5-like [Daphnia pulex]|uniref:venom allergen 5-like n=1 Tax=Daphnia pulex TaxID=6669 RepID=UPI001EDCF64D|nr:venom allergen 5-like [Daphnia pulex]